MQPEWHKKEAIWTPIPLAEILIERRKKKGELFKKQWLYHGWAIQYLNVKFSAEKNDANMEAAIFIGVEIRELNSEGKFGSKLNPLDLVTWNSFISMADELRAAHVAEKRY